MNKTKFFSSLLVVALIATTSVFTSCKDYDDDIKNLQTQIDKAALKSELDALQTQLNGVKTTAEKGVADAANALSAAGVAKDAADKAQAAADKAAEAAAKAITDAANAQNTADVAKAAAEAAQLTADAAKALGEAAATKEELEAAKKELAADAKKTADALDALAKAAATKAELNEAVTTLTALAEAAKALADAAATKTELNEAVQNLTALIDNATKVELKTAKTELETFAQTAAKQAKEAAISESKAYAEGLAEQIEEKVANTLKNYATNEALTTLTENLYKSLDDLKKEIMGAADTNVEALAFAVGQYAKQIDVLFCAITSIELVESYSGGPFYQGSLLGYWGAPIDLGFYHGSVSENSVFGDEAYKNADKLIEYKAGDDIKGVVSGLVVRVNPVNADLSTADIKLINSKGEDISDILEVAGVMPLNDYVITRGANMKSGLWAVFFNVADGVTEEAFNEKVIYKDEYEIEREILFAIAANNTVSDNADRYAVSSYDIRPWYGKYKPALSFTFDVNDESVNNIRNRWTGNVIYPEAQGPDTRNPGVPERAWAYPTDDYPTPAIAPIIKADGTGNTEIDQNKYYQETRRFPQYSYPFVYADVNEPFVISNIEGYNDNSYAQQIDYYYVVFDKENAVESVPSEWNAWNSYEVEGLGVMTDADESLTMKITSESAHGDVVGFRVYAVNRDGTLADPDGRAFYVFVGKPGDDHKSAAAEIIATKEQPESEAMDVTGWFQDGKYYYFTTYNEENENTNPKWYYGSNSYGDFSMGNVKLNFYKKNASTSFATVNSDATVAGSIIKDAVKVTFTPNSTIAGMLNDETYTVYIRRFENNVPSAEDYYPYATLSITKKLPTEARNPEFRPKQEGDWDNGKWTTKDGSGKFMAYMIPNASSWSAPWAYNFNESYEVASSNLTNGYKDLNNVFYNLNNDRDLEFVFETSLKKGNKNVDLVDGNGQGIVYGTPGASLGYVLDVATSFIDAKTEHNVKVSTLYKYVSTYFDEDENLHYAETHKVAGNDLTAVYACWHHATHDIAWAKDKTPSLQWKAEGNNQTSKLTDLTTKNSYNNDYFGLSIGQLLENKWISYVESAELNTQKDGKGQKNPYFKPTVDASSKQVTFTQTSTQVDANPTDNHEEYLIMKFKDAFGHEIKTVTTVTIKKAASASRRF